MLHLPPIPADANKYSRGSLLILAGSARFPGAAVLCAQAAARTGAGYVTLAVPASVAPAAQTHLLSIPLIAATEGSGAFAPEALTDILRTVTHIDAIVCGPGLTDAPDALAFAAQVARTVSVPLLLDADALRVAGSRTTHQASSAGLLADDGAAPLILTPHAGELRRLLAATGATDAADLAQRIDAVVVAKGPQTLIVSPERSQLFTSGTPALAKAGTGDVLSGIIGALLAQGMEPFEAACTGVELHGRAGHSAAERLGIRSVMAEDLIVSLAEVLRFL
jgi:NAD(P)H-hydrate epimerase